VRQKILHKGSYWSHHGRHKGMLVVCIQRNRELSRPKRKTPMFDTVLEALAHYARRR
jgi:hypothetical protein